MLQRQKKLFYLNFTSYLTILLVEKTYIHYFSLLINDRILQNNCDELNFVPLFHFLQVQHGNFYLRVVQIFPVYPGSQPWLQAPSALSQELSPPQVALQLSEQSAPYLPASHSGKRFEERVKRI